MRPLISLFFAIQFNAIATERITVTIEKDIYDYAQTILKGQTVHTIDNFKHPLCQRDIVEYVILQKALTLGGLSLKFEFDVGNYDARNIKLLVDGLLLVSFDTIWLDQANQYRDKLYISAPIIRKGEYYAGIYTKPENMEVLKAKINRDLSQLSMISSKAWHTDWQTLNSLKPKNLIDESDWVIMAKMVSRGWVDGMLVSFNNTQPFEYSGEGYRIAAIDGIKVALQDSRHFAVSRAHPMGKTVFEALQTGLKRLREEGFIRRSYQQCGFFNDVINDWRELKSQQ